MNDQPDETAVFVADLRAGTGGAACLRRGWSDPEPHGTWTLGRESRFAIDWSPHWRDATLVVQATPHLFPGLDAARLEMSANGIPLGGFSLPGSAQVTCPVAGWMIGAGRTLEVVLRQPDAARPSAVSAATDTRELGFVISRLALRCRSAPAATPVATPEAAVLHAFAGLGDIGEFGLAQRRCGVETRGPFGFARVSLADLIAGLDGRFEGLDDPDALSVMLLPRHWIAGPRQYLVYNSTYDAAWPADAFEGEQPAERVREAEQRKVGDLKRALLEDLAAATRIYVVRRARPLERAEAVALWHALRRHGPNALLWVVPADAQHRAGTVVVVEPGLFQGFIDHLAPNNDPSDLSTRGWVELCRRTLQLHKSG